MKIVFNNTEITGSIEDVLLPFQVNSSLSEISSSNNGGGKFTIPDDTIVLDDKAFAYEIANNQHGAPVTINFEGDPPILEGNPFFCMDVNIHCDLTNPKWIAAQTEWGRNPGGAFTVRWYQKS
jgi:hypothetical protein